MRYLSTQAKDDPYFYVYNEIGYNYRMTDLQAALGVAQMEELPGFIRRKQLNYERYRELFAGFLPARLMPFRNGVFSNKWLCALEMNRDQVSVPVK